MVKRHDTDFSIFKRNRMAVMFVADNTIQTHDFPGHLKSCHLFAAIF